MTALSPLNFLQQNLSGASKELSSTDFNQSAMNLAFYLAAQNKNFVAPNPAVGCVIVKDRRILAMGSHPFPGEGHAEVQAVNNLKRAFPTNWQEMAEGSTFYVTLEPCSHFGKTPPCALLLKELKIKKLYYGFKDSTKKVAGKGIALLQESGVECSYLPSPQTQILNQDFFYLDYLREFRKEKLAQLSEKACKGRDAKGVKIRDEKREPELKEREQKDTDQGTANKAAESSIRLSSLSLNHQDIAKEISSLFSEEELLTSLPYLRVKIGASLDGRLALPNGESKWVTNSLSRSQVQALRYRSDAILCSSTTVFNDDASYNVRREELPAEITFYLNKREGEGTEEVKEEGSSKERRGEKEVKLPHPYIIVVDNEFLLHKELKLFTCRKDNLEKLIILSQEKHPLSQEEALKGTNFISGFNSYQGQAWRELLLYLELHWGLKDILIETGPRLLAFFLEEKLYHEIHYFRGGVLLGQGANALSTLSEAKLLAECSKLNYLYSLDLEGDNYSLYLSPLPQSKE